MSIGKEFHSLAIGKECLAVHAGITMHLCVSDFVSSSVHQCLVEVRCCRDCCQSITDPVKHPYCVLVAVVEVPIRVYGA